MKLKDFVENLHEMILESPELLEMTVITSSDDEGNSFDEVHYIPTPGFFNRDEREFFHLEEDLEEFEIEKSNFNAICIN